MFLMWAEVREVNEFLNVIRDAGLNPPDYIEPGRLHRFPGREKGNSNRAGWCWLAEDQKGGAFGDWCTDSKQTWHAKNGKALSPIERKWQRDNIAQAIAQADAERAKIQTDAAGKAVEIWRDAKPVSLDHEYLISKGIKPHGARLRGKSLLLPLREGEKIHSLQFVSPNGDKRFLSGGRVKGCYFSIGKPGDTLLITEGFATGASCHAVTGFAVAVAFNSGNLKAVAEALREKLPEARIVICADNDTETKGNPGVTKATEAAIAVGGYIAIPSQHGDFNDLARLYGSDAVHKSIQSAKAMTGEQHVRDAVNEKFAESDLSHDALALKLSSSGWSGTARYVHNWSKWVFWNGQRWELDEQLSHYTKIRKFLRGIASDITNEATSKEEGSGDTNANKSVQACARSLRRKETITSVESLARSNADLVAKPTQFDSNPMLIGTSGGTVDLTTGGLSEAKPSDWITRLCATTPTEAGTKAPLWQTFLDRTFDGNREIISFMQRAVGYALTGHIREHKLFFLYGTGRNGKSVFLDTIFQIMGDYSKRSASQTFLDNKNESHPTALAGLMGARLVAGSELPAGKAWNESVIKDLTGGDVISARFMRQDYFDYMPQFTLFIAGNHQPAFRGIDEAIRARVVLVPFTQTIPESERDPKLSEKLKQEWPAIFRWMIEGAVEWNANGLQVPEAIKAASAEYLDAEDTLGEFLDEHVEYAREGKVTVAEVYERFTGWQEAIGTRPWSTIAMSKALKERGIEHIKMAQGVRGFGGIVLRPTSKYVNKWKDD